jgi:gamma-glutamylcyclotransferase (GGCT)/AIG2-like uncharacterized protein YtfP
MENLFSYGTLQSKQVQLDVFGRVLNGQPDILIGYKKELIKIKEHSDDRSNSEGEYVTLIGTGDDVDMIEGVVFLVTEAELQKADEYETDAYKKVEVLLQSGNKAWVYVKKEND